MMSEIHLLRVTRGLFNVLVLFLVLDPVRCDTVDLFRTACPYTKLCTMDRLLDVPRNGSAPCCLDCLCDEACHAYRDCCPDVDAAVPQEEVTSGVQCISSTAPTVYKDFAEMPLPNSYRMFSTCPGDYTDTEGTFGKCEEEVYTADRSYGDMVIVSDPNNVLYRNNYCAMCHGVTDVIRWELNVHRCRSSLGSVLLESSKLKAYIMQNCILASGRPESLPLNSRLLPCQQNTIGDCSNVRSGGEHDLAIVLCENGPYLPYRAKSYLVYKNVFCFECNTHGGDIPQLCQDNLMTKTMSSTGGTTASLNIDDGFSTTTPETICGESKIWDYYTNECVTLHCPPLETVSFGTCRPIFISGPGTVSILAVYWTTYNITVSRPVEHYNTSMRLYHGRQLRERFADLGCSGTSVDVTLVTDIGTDEFLYLRAGITLERNSRHCTIRGIGDIIRNQQHLTGSWLINGVMVTMKGQYSFFRYGEGRESWGSRPVREILLQEYEVKFRNQFDIIEEFIVCPYLEIDLEMYNNFLMNIGHTGNVTNLASLSDKTETMKGVYALSECKLAVCVDRYLYKSNGANEEKLSLPLASQIVLLWSVITFLLTIHE